MLKKKPFFEAFEGNSKKLPCLFSSTKDRGDSSHILIDHTLIPCTLLKLYMAIQLHTPLMMNEEQILDFNTTRIEIWLTPHPPYVHIH